ncbi:MAG: aspartate/glutamate racemase family protein [Pseudomonadota bacterium]
MTAAEEKARLGILMLETRCPRLAGDIGNPATFPFPVITRVVPGAAPERVVRRAAEGLLGAFLDAASELVAAGADGLATSCGFLSLYQRQLAGRAGVPVATSSLMQVPVVQGLLPPGQLVGVLTVDAASLSPAHLEAVGADPSTPVMGTEGGREFTRVFLGDLPELDREAAERDIIEAGRALVARHPRVGAIVLECTNMAPYARALRDRLGLPVFDITSFIAWFHAGLKPRDWR